jgi:hypothetical protein
MLPRTDQLLRSRSIRGPAGLAASYVGGQFAALELKAAPDFCSAVKVKTGFPHVCRWTFMPTRPREKARGMGMKGVVGLRYDGNR